MTAPLKRNRVAYKTHSRVIEMMKPGPVTVYDMRDYSHVARPVTSIDPPAAKPAPLADSGTYADALNAAAAK